ncbi:hypothetical protein WAI05_23740, partial [Acinetobacter baumannii]
QQRVQELERQLAERPAGGGGFLSGLFGGQSSAPAAPAQRSMTPRPNPFGHGATTAPGMAAPGMMGAGMGSPWGGRPG